MKKLTIIFLIPVFIFFGCKKETEKVHFLKATIVQTSDVSCNLPVLNFSEDSLKIRTLTRLNNLYYSVIDLAEKDNIKGKKLYVSVRTLKPEEEFPCNSLGISYPHLKILDVRER